MRDIDRTTQGGVGAVLLGLALAAVAMAAGWLAGSASNGRVASGACDAACASSAAAASDRAPALATSTIPTPVPTEPVGFPFVSARSIAVIESSCGALIYGRDEHLHLPPASLTKLMTAAVAADHADTSTLITAHVDGVTLYEQTGSTIMGLKPGMELSLLDLLYGMLLPSGNDAAIAIAEGVGGTQERFVELMNDKAQSLALDDSHFTNPHGLYDNSLYSSAYDMG